MLMMNMKMMNFIMVIIEYQANKFTIEKWEKGKRL